MKIAYVFDDSLDRTDGVQQYVRTLGNWMQDHGNEVYYLVGETKNAESSNIHSLAKNVTVRFNKNQLSVPLPANKKRIKTLLEKIKPDILHVQLPYSPLLSGKIIDCADENTIIVGTFHIVPYSSLHKAGSRLLGLAEKRRLKKFGNLISVSEPARKCAKQYFHIESLVIPNAVDIAKYKSGKSTSGSKINIVYLGRLVERKGADKLILAISRLNDGTKSKIRVVIGGRGPLESKLKSLVNSLGLTQIVEFRGFIAESEKADFLSSADIAVFPSTGGESFGIVLVEAMAAARGAVVAHPNDGYSEVLSEVPDSLLEMNHSSEFSLALDHLINNPNTRKVLSSRQKALVKSYDINKIGPKILKIYKSKLVARKAT